MPLRGLASTVACAAIAVLGMAAPAAAHPFGDPQTVAIGGEPARPDVVRVRWKVGGLDDLTVLGVALGLLPPDRVLLDGAVFYRDSDAAAIGPSPRFAEYLLERVTVASDGRDCAGRVAPPEDLARTGATIDFTCPGPVGVVSVAVRTLTDLDPAYRTFATGPGGVRAVYTSDAYSHEWRLGDVVPAATGGPALQLGLVLGGIAVASGAALALARVVRRRRRVVA